MITEIKSDSVLLFIYRILLQVRGLASLVPRLLPYRKTGREPGRTDHVPRDVLCVVLCVVLIIELLPTQSVLSVISADTAIVVCR